MDPLILKIVAVSMGMLFLLAAVHKLMALAEFRAVVADYRLLPPRLESTMANVLPVVELVTGLAWMFLQDLRTVAAVSALLLIAYAAAIAINIFRGRVHIGCGCGFGASSTDQPLSKGLVLRNLLLAMIALLAVLPASGRTLGAYDYVSLVAALLTVIFLFVATNQLIRNGVALRLQRGKGRRHHD